MVEKRLDIQAVQPEGSHDVKLMIGSNLSPAEAIGFLEIVKQSIHDQATKEQKSENGTFNSRFNFPN
jgi:hypothetical protein